VAKTNKLLIGMILLALGGLIAGAAIGYVGTHMYLNNRVLADLKKEGYVLTEDANATASDIVKGKTAYVNGELITGTMSVLDTSDATAMSEYIAKGKTAYVNGELVIGKMKVMTGQEITTKGASIDIPGGAYAEGDIVIKGDSDLTPDNIKSGVLIFGVQGTYTAEEPKYTITYKLDGGSNHSANPSTYRKSETPLTLHDPTREGYTFDGWISEDISIQGTVIPKGTSGDLTFIALWSKIPEPEPEPQPEPEPIVEPVDGGEEGGQG